MNILFNTKEYALLRGSFRFIGLHKKWIFISVAKTAVTSLFILMMPVLMKQKANTIYSKSFQNILETPALSIILLVASAFVIIITISSFTGSLIDLNIKYLKEVIQLNIQKELFSKINRMGYHESCRFSTGEILSLQTNDAHVVSWTLSNIFIMKVLVLVMLAGGIIALWNVSWFLLLISLASVPMFLIGYIYFGNRIKPLKGRYLKFYAGLKEFYVEKLDARIIPRLFNCHDRFSGELETLNSNLLDSAYKVYQCEAYKNIFGQVFEAVWSSILVSAGIVMLKKGFLNFGEITTFIFYIGLLYNPLGRAGTLILTMKQFYPAIERILKVVDTPVPGNIQARQIPQLSAKESLKFTSVHFSYDNKCIFKDVSLSIKKSEKVLVTGHTGSGKTTFAMLSAGLYTPDHGGIHINGISSSSASRKTLSQLVGFVPQQSIVFNGSIRYNITLGSEDYNPEQIRRALYVSAMEDFVLGLDKGLNEVIGKSAHELSGGESQRIAIARVILRDPEILILDESTSNLDTETENILLQRLMEYSLEKTVLFITHRYQELGGFHRHLDLDKLYSSPEGHVSVEV